MVLFAGTLTALLLFLMDLRAGHWWLLLLTAAAAAAFAVRELHVADPFLDLRVLGSNGPLMATYGRNLLTFVVSYAFLYGYTQWLEDGRELYPSAAGLVLLPMFAVAIVASVLTGRRRGVRGKLVGGSIAQLVACGLLLALHPTSPVWLLVLVSVIVGVPQGVNSLANQNAVYHQADLETIGSSAGCCARSPTSVRSSPRRPTRRCSPRARTPRACTSWRCSSSRLRRCCWPRRWPTARCRGSELTGVLAQSHAGVGGERAGADRRRPAAPGRAGRCPSRGRARSGCGCAPAASAAPTCTWPRATCRRGGRRSRPATRWSASSTRVGPGASRFRPATGSACAWLGGTDGTCRFCRRGAENLCLPPDVHRLGRRRRLRRALPGREEFAYRAAGRSRRRAGRAAAVRRDHRLPGAAAAAVPPGGALGSTASAASAHLAAQVALAEGLRVHVLHPRRSATGELAPALGADSAGDSADEPPEPLDGAVLFAPAGELVPVALRALDRGGTLAVAGIWLSDIPPLTTPPSCSRSAGCAASPPTPGPTARSSSGWRPGTGSARPRSYAFARADRALADLAHGRFGGAAVLHVRMTPLVEGDGLRSADGGADAVAAGAAARRRRRRARRAAAVRLHRPDPGSDLAPASDPFSVA